MISNRLSNQALIGLVVILIGALLLVDSLDILDTGGVFRWWPSLLVIFGVWRLIANRFTRIIGPVVLVSIGVLLQLLFLGYDVGDLWPVALILLGVMLLIGGSRFREGRRRDAGTPDIDTINAVGVFSEAKLRSSTANFKGGQATAVFGGVNLDFSGAQVPDPPAFLEVTVLFGSAEIRVPTDWVVKIDVPVLFGGSEDKRIPSQVSGTRTPDLVIKGTVMFGGITLKD
jgi:predicted membrane protein